MNKIKIFLVVSVAAIGSAGCKDDAARQREAREPDTRQHGEQFLAAGELGTAQKVDRAQQAVGARADASLHACHFENAKLNSLGEEKLRLMMQGREDAGTPLIVFVDTPTNDPRFGEREDSIKQFCDANSLATNQLEIHHGMNPASISPASGHIQNLTKAEEKAAEKAGADDPFKVK